MLLIQGPFPINSTALVLPSPRETNTESLKASVQTIRMMDGGLRTYVKRRDGRKSFRWEFLVGNPKGKQIEDYFIANGGEKAMVSWNDATYIGYCTLNPLELSGEADEYFRVLIEFEEA